MGKKMLFEKSAFIPDIHAPYHDDKALNCALDFLRYFKPDYVFILGDVVDMYQVSKFDKNPARINQLQDDIDAAHQILYRIRKAAPDVPMWMLEGNHERRMKKVLWRDLPALSSLRGLKVDQLLGLPDLGIKYVEDGSMKFHGFLIKHGNVVRTRSGYTATGEMEKAGISGISGHTHRLSQVYKTNYSGMSTWVEAGCLCDLRAEYMEGQVADWQHGLAYGWFEKDDKRFVVHTTPIIKGRLVFDGRRIGL